MKKTILILFSAMSLSSSVFADSVNPPVGPYRTMVGIDGFISSVPESNESNSFAAQVNSSVSVPVNKPVKKSDPDWSRQRINNMQVWQNQQRNQQPQQWGTQQYNQAETPDWVKQRQLEMKKRMQQFHAQQQAQQQNWEKQQAWNRNQPVQPEALNTQPETSQNDQALQYFPSARGKVYGPQAVPPAYYAPPRQPAYQARRPMPQYAPRWK